METVEVVIRIPKNEYDRIQKSEDIIYDDWIVDVARAIANGTVLPKGHGALKDVDMLKKCATEVGEYTDAKAVWKDDIEEAPTVIEADRGEKE